MVLIYVCVLTSTVLECVSMSRNVLNQIFTDSMADKVITSMKYKFAFYSMINI